MGVISLLGITLAGTLMWQAGRVVDELLSRPIWAEAGQITGTARLAPDMKLGPEDVAGVLLDAGFSRVRNVKGLQEFTVDPSGMLIRQPEGDTLLTFNDWGIASVSPDGLLVLDGVELTGLDRDRESARQPVRSAEIPAHISQAILAMEDSRFFEHPGFDWMGIIRAVAANTFGSGFKQGGSTLTQQLVKNLFLTPDRTLERKLKELFLALALEQRIGKTEILDLYLNQVYLGHIQGIGIGGIGQAARMYFGVSPNRLSLAQAATLAGIISAPNRYSPLRHPEKAKDRRDIVLRRMEELGWISAAMAEATRRLPLETLSPRTQQTSPWGVEHAKNMVESVLGEGSVANGTLRIQTTLDPALQKVAEESVRLGLEGLGPQYAEAQVALVAMNAMNGHILAMIGGRNHSESTFNRAVFGQRQMGSIVKPFSWMFAYDANPSLHPNSPVDDVPISFFLDGDIWEPQNHDGTFETTVSMRKALGRSRNIPAVHVAQMVGFEQLMGNLEAIGIGPQAPLPSMALGAFEVSPMALCAAFGVFPQQGMFTPPRIVRSVRLPDGQEGWRGAARKRRIASKAAAFMASDDLRGVMEEGTGKRIGQMIRPGHVVAGKTGTTNEARDSWFVGYSGQLVVAVWVGFDKGRALGLTGAQAAGPIFGKFLDGSGWLDTDHPSTPQGVDTLAFCADSQARAMESCPSRYSGWTTTLSQVMDCTAHAGPFNSRTQQILDSLRRTIRPSRTAKQKQSGPKPKRKSWLRRKESDAKP